MTTIQDIERYLEAFAPQRLATEWDNVGLLAGDRSKTVHRAMTCLTVTSDTVAEAMEERADLVRLLKKVGLFAADRLRNKT